MLLLGVKSTYLGEIELAEAFCAYCDEDQTMVLYVEGRYLHITWIPFISVGKEAVSECKHCKQVNEFHHFHPNLKNRFFALRNKFKTPWWHWIGLALFILILLFEVF